MLCAGESESDRHVVQADDPVTFLYLPVTQSEHGPAFGPVDPALQAQSTSNVLCVGEIELDGHVRQAGSCKSAKAMSPLRG